MAPHQAMLPQRTLTATVRSAAIRLFDESGSDLKARLIAIGLVLVGLNIGAWLWALLAFSGKPVLLGIALMIYGLGLRHAVDADHIAAIDNVTRKLTQENKRPVSVGFFFALGHSTVVILVAAAVATAAATLSGFELLRSFGGALSTGISALFLFAIAATNIAIFVSVYRTYRQVRRDGADLKDDPATFGGNRGLLSRVLRPLFRLITHSWQMFPLGLFFGLSFDTATEVSMFAISASQAASGISLGLILVFPLLFAAGMTLVDTADGVVMLAAYEWAFVKPMRKLYYNMTITLVSVLVALAVGGIEVLTLIRNKFGLAGAFWESIAAAGANFNTLGLVVIGLFLVAWLAAYLFHRARKGDEATISVTSRAP
jgi:nickel/cobalt transporter (NiCoT) family protein